MQCRHCLYASLCLRIISRRSLVNLTIGTKRRRERKLYLSVTSSNRPMCRSAIKPICSPDGVSVDEPSLASNRIEEC